MKTQRLIDTTALDALSGFGALLFNTPPADRARLEEIMAEVDEIQLTADAAGRDLTTEENRRIDQLYAEFRRLDMETTASQRRGRRSEPSPTPNGRFGNGQPSRRSGRQVPRPPRQQARVAAGTEWFNATFGTEATDADSGFSGWADYLGALAGVTQGHPDDRLQAYRPRNAGMTEGTGSTGGFLVPVELLPGVLGPAFIESGLLSRVTVIPMSSNMASVMGIDTHDHTDGSIGGLTLNWVAEGEDLSEQTPSLVAELMRAKKGSVLVPVTNELLDDTAVAEVQLRSIMQQAARAGLEWAVLTGNGAGHPRGVLNDPALITAAKESGQAADTIVYENIVNMVARMHPNLLPGAIWVASPTILPQLLTMQFSVRNSSLEVVGGERTPVTMSGDQAGMYRLLGLPLVFSETLPVVGDLGDIVLVNPSEYMLGLRLDAQIQVSTHEQFSKDKTVFRLILRADGQGRWTGPATPKVGSTLSWAVTLAARA